MIEFLHAVRDYGFMRYALIAGVLASVACGLIGTYVVVRRITYVAGGISHCVLGGMGLALYLHRVAGWTWLAPLYGAVAAALIAAAVVGVVSLRAKEREDTIISAMWAIGMAVGVLAMSQTPGYNEDLMSYLFGNILMVSKRDLWLIAGLDLTVVVIGLRFYREFVAICFDEEFARARGLRVEMLYLLLLFMTALTVVLLVSVVGIVMVIALLTLPVAVAGFFSRTVWQMMALAVVLSTVFTTAGLAVSYSPSLPAGATIIVLAGAAYLLILAGRGLVTLLRS